MSKADWAVYDGYMRATGGDPFRGVRGGNGESGFGLALFVIFVVGSVVKAIFGW